MYASASATARATSDERRGSTPRPVLIYVSPEFPKPRHGFEAAELQSLSAQYDVWVISLRRPTSSGREWLAGGTQELPVRITSLRPSDALRGCVTACVRSPGRFLRVLVMYLGLCRYDLRGGLKAFLGGCAGAGVAELARASGAAWIHADFASAPASAALVAGRVANCRWSFTGHAFDVFSSKPAGRATEPLLALKLREADVVFAANSEVKARLDALRRIAGVTATCTIRRNGVRLPPESSPARFEPFSVVGLGALTAKKGFDTLVRAVALAKEEVPMRLAIHGEGEERVKLTQLADALGVQLDLPGFFPPSQLSAILGAASVVVMPSRVLQDGDSDGVPTVLIEALAHRRPVIGTHVGAVADLIRHRETGLLVEPDDPIDLAAALVQFARHPSLAVRLADAGFELVRREFTAEGAMAVFQREIVPKLGTGDGTVAC